MAKEDKLNKIIDILEYSQGIIKNKSSKKISSQPIKNNFAKLTFDSLKNLDAIYFTGEYPLIYFKTLSDFTPEIIKELHKNIWNQSRIPLMFVITPIEIRIYDCYKQPLSENDTDINKLEVDRFMFRLEALRKMKAIYHQSMMDSGQYWETASGKKINASKRVDQLLISNLKEARRQLVASLDLEYDIALPIIHNLLSRSLFILYLEDRKVINGNYYSEYLDSATSYFDILNDASACYRMFNDLNQRFHGNLFVTSKQEIETIDQNHMQVVRQCFYGDAILKQQFTMWRMFNFSYIPIELISSIYEEFLHMENSSNTISRDGAYYTPQCLAEFVLNEMLPYPDENNKNYEIKILDPACGSGIFLVESYKRLIERWKYSNSDTRLSSKVLKDILLNSIYGIEKNAEAIKVASLSLYLTMLNYLEPKYIWKNVHFPNLINNGDISADANNLFLGDTFSNEDFKKNNYDLIVGNPPWKVSNLDDTVTEYIKENKLPAQIVAAFLHLLPNLFVNSKIGIVSTSKILFNNGKRYDTFREFLFQQVHIQTIVNFSALRQVKRTIGRNLFSSAIGPACIIFYQSQSPNDVSSFITYCTPKPDRKNNAISELIIDSSDIKYIPRYLALNNGINIWKIAMYGTTRDYLLINSLKQEPTLREFIKSVEWVKESGFETSEPRKQKSHTLNKLPFIDAGKIERYYSFKKNTTPITDVNFYRTGDERIYLAPHILIKEGQKDKQFCVSYLDYDCSFRKTVYGIHHKDSDLLKALTVYLNSRLVSYLLFMTSSNWGIEREIVNSNEVLSLSFYRFLHDRNIINIFSKYLDKIVEYKTTILDNSEELIKKAENEIDQLIYDNLNLTKEDIFLIDNVMDYSLNFFHYGDRSAAILPALTEEIKKYSKTICNNINTLLKDLKKNVWASVYHNDLFSPLSIISLHFNNIHENNEVIERDEIDVNKLLRSLNKFIYQKHSETIYFRKVIKYYSKDIVYIVKPNEKRFWTNAIALEDSDLIFLEMANTN